MNCDKSRPVIHKHDNNEELMWLFESNLDLIMYMASQNPGDDFDHLGDTQVHGNYQVISMKSFFHSQTDEQIRCQIKSIPIDSTVEEIKSVLAHENTELGSKKFRLRIGMYQQEFCFVFQTISSYCSIRHSFNTQSRKVCNYTTFLTPDHCSILVYENA